MLHSLSYHHAKTTLQCIASKSGNLLGDTRFMPGQVLAVSDSAMHGFSKTTRDSITLLTGLGVEGDAHCGVTVKHRSRVAQNPDQPNLRQVHLIHCELFSELASKGYSVTPGQLGENITTDSINLLALPVDTVLHIGATARLRLTGLRNPCGQLDKFQPGLMAAVLDEDANGETVRKSGVMAIVLEGGIVSAGDGIVVTAPPGGVVPLGPV